MSRRAIIVGGGIGGLSVATALGLRGWDVQVLEQAPELTDSWAAAALEVNPDAIVLVHGGPVAMPEDAEFVLKHTKNCHGFYGASSMERLPTEVALTEQTRKFKQIGR